MDSYLHPENQHKLWTTVTQIPMFHSLPQQQKEYEFKRIIKFFHEKTRNEIRSKSDLQRVNKETILSFVEQFKNPHASPSPSLTSQNRPFGFVETRQEQYQRQFQERQQSYEQMVAKPSLPSPDIFLEKNVEEKAITDELIEEYQRQRAAELQKYSIPPPNLTTPNPKKPSFHIEGEIEDPIVLGIMPLDNDDNNNTHVKWSDSLVDPITEEETRWISVRNQFLVFEKRLEKMEHKLEEMQTKLSQTQALG